MFLLDSSSDIIDLRDLAEELRDYDRSGDDAQLDQYLLSDLVDTLRQLNDLLSNVGASPAHDGTHPGSVADALEEYANNEESTLIRLDYFETYAQELAHDVIEGMDDERSQSWPFRHIDWEAAAAELRNEYNDVELDGTEYVIRAS